MIAPTPNRIDLIGDEIALCWSDGTESYFSTDMLRESCPCALCNGESDITGRVAKPVIVLRPESKSLRSYEMIGGYALRLIWGDGHASGLYSFDYLRKLEKKRDQVGS
jgi:DUF971 family protein